MNGNEGTKGDEDQISEDSKILAYLLRLQYIIALINLSELELHAMPSSTKKLFVA